MQKRQHKVELSGENIGPQGLTLGRLGNLQLTDFARQAHLQHEPLATTATKTTPPKCAMQKNLLSRAADCQLPSPAQSNPHQIDSHKRKRLASGDTTTHEPPKAAKRRYLAGDRRESLDKKEYNPTAQWVFTRDWPEDFGQRGRKMGDSSTGTKRRSDSTHRSAYIERLEEQGVYMRTSTLIKNSWQPSVLWTLYTCARNGR